MEYNEAISALDEIVKRKKENPDNSTTTPDTELAKRLDDAEAVIKLHREKEALEKQKTDQNEVRELVLKAGFAHDSIVTPRGGFQALLRKNAGEDPWLKRFHRWNDDVVMLGLVMEKPAEYVMKRFPHLGDFYEQEIRKTTSELAKAIATSIAGAGLEFTPQEILSPELIDLIRNSRDVFALFRRFDMAGPTVKLGQVTADFVGFVVAESTGNDPFATPTDLISNIGSGDTTLTAVEILAAAIFSKTFEEDAVVGRIPELRANLITGMGGSIEDATLNGSVESPHPDSDVSTSGAATAWNGLRAEAQGQDFTDQTATVALDGANMTLDNVLKLTLLQGRFGKDSDNVFITSNPGLVKLAGVRDSAGNQVLATLQNYGQQAVVTTGVAGARANFFGAPVIVSDFIKTNMDATGVVPQTPEDRTIVIRANKPAFRYGDRRMLTIETDSAPITRQRIMVATERLIFARVQAGQSAGDRPVTIGRNVETS